MSNTRTEHAIRTVRSLTGDSRLHVPPHNVSRDEKVHRWHTRDTAVVARSHGEERPAIPLYRRDHGDCRVEDPAHLIAALVSALAVLDTTPEPAPAEEPWDNALPQAVAECMAGRESPEAGLATRWLQQNENSEVVWSAINRLCDEFERLAARAETDAVSDA